jgi:hypothetical protein
MIRIQIYGYGSGTFRESTETGSSMGGKEDRPGLGIDVREYKRIKDAVARTHCGIGIGVFTNKLKRHYRPCSFWRPAVSGVTDPAESRLIFEHDPYPFGIPRNFFYYFGEFFLNSS